MRKIILMSLISLSVLSSMFNQYPDGSLFTPYNGDVETISVSSVDEKSLNWYRSSQYLLLPVDNLKSSIPAEILYDLPEDLRSGSRAYYQFGEFSPASKFFGDPTSISVGNIKSFPAPDSAFLLDTTNDTLEETDIMETKGALDRPTYDPRTSFLIPRGATLVLVEIVQADAGNCLPESESFKAILKGSLRLEVIQDDNGMGSSGKYVFLPAGLGAECKTGSSGWLFILVPGTDVDLESLYIYRNNGEEIWTTAQNIERTKDNQGEIAGLAKGVTQIYPRVVEDTEVCTLGEYHPETEIEPGVVIGAGYDRQCVTEYPKVSPKMAVVESIPSTLGSDQDVNFAMVYDVTYNKVVALENYSISDDSWVERDRNLWQGSYFGDVDIDLGIAHWIGDIAAGQTVLFLDASPSYRYCRIVGTSMQGWDVDGWVKCSRLGPVPEND